MKSRVTYYAGRKNVLVWLAVIFSLCAAASYIAAVTCVGGVGVSGTRVWLRCVLPVLAAVYFAWQTAWHSEERIYRVSLSWWLLTASFFYETIASGIAWYGCVLVCVALFGAAVLLTRVISGKSKQDWLIIALSGVLLAALIWRNGGEIHEGFSWQTWLPFLPDALMLLAFIVLDFAVKAYPDDGKYRPTWSDRPDGRRIRTLSPITVVASYIMPNRNGASNQFKDSLEITPLEKYIRQKKISGFEGFGITEVFLAAYVRVIAKYPAANRFLSGQKIYSRDEDIQFCMVIKKDMSTEVPDTIIKLHLNPADTVDEIYKKFHAAVTEVHKSDELDSSFDGVAHLLSVMPGVILKFTVWVLKVMDYFGLLPKVLLEVSPFHGSVFFTSMGSLGIPAIYHHLYDFGNLPVFCAFGCKRRVNEVEPDGTPVEHKYIDYSFTLDERTTDGFYYATAFKYFRKLLQHPERLELPPEVVEHDIQ